MPARPVRLDIVLEVGALTETVTVASGLGLLDARARWQMRKARAGR
jgi:hypothetical protein